MLLRSFLSIAILGAAVLATPAETVKNDTVTWTEAWGGEVQKCALQINVINNPDKTEASLSFKFSFQEEGKNFSIQERADTFHDDLWSEIALAIPIRVKGDERPQLLVKRWRPNWLDYEIYASTRGGIMKVFSYSCRDEASVKWLAKNGALERFVTFDRFANPKPKEPTGQRYQNREEWVFDSKTEQWKTVGAKWALYRSEEGFSNPVISSASDCRFLFKSR